MKMQTITFATAVFVAAAGAIPIWGTSTAQAQNTCTIQCHSNGWGLDQCKKYCETRPEGSR